MEKGLKLLAAAVQMPNAVNQISIAIQYYQAFAERFREGFFYIKQITVTNEISIEHIILKIVIEKYFENKSRIILYSLYMKKIIFAGLCAAVIFTSCENEAQKRSRKTVKELTSYVDSVKKLSPDYSDEFWKNIEDGYKERDAKATALESNMLQSDKKELEDTRNKFMDYQSRYEDEKIKYDNKITQDKRQKMLNDFFGEGKAADLTFAWVNETNIIDVYKNFVSKVNDNKDSYNKQDWDEINMIMDGLDNRKEAIEKSLSNKQNLKIKEYKAKFSAIKILS
jgi:hypothetical protein